MGSQHGKDEECLAKQVPASTSLMAKDASPLIGVWYIDGNQFSISKAHCGALLYEEKSEKSIGLTGILKQEDLWHCGEISCSGQHVGMLRVRAANDEPGTILLSIKEDGNMEWEEAYKAFATMKTSQATLAAVDCEEHGADAA